MKRLLIVSPMLLCMAWFISSCEDREYTNPHDPKTPADFWAPSDLSAKQLKEGGITVINKVELSWTDNAKGEDGYIIDRKIADGAWKEGVGQVGEDVTNWIDSSFQLKVGNHYQVYGFASKNNSNPISSKINPVVPAPAALVITQEALDVIKLRWLDKSIGEDGFIIDRKIGDNDSTFVAELGLVGENVTEWRDTIDITGLINNHLFEYKYWVKTFYNADTQLYSLSEIASITPNMPDPPSKINILSVEYDFEEMIVKWEPLSDNDSLSYKLLYSSSIIGIYDTLDIDTLDQNIDKTSTSYSLTDFDPTYANWFWIEVTDFWGRNYFGNSMTNTIDSPPTSSKINSISYEYNSFVISWSQNNDNDFESYTLSESFQENMNGATDIFTTNNSNEISHTVTDVSEGELRYYQIITQDVWGLESLSNIKTANTSNVFLKTFIDGNSQSARGYSVQQTTDFGYIITGSKVENGGQSSYVWLIKTDTYGNEEWNKTFGGNSGFAHGRSVQQTTDGGYIITGENVDSDLWLIKTDPNGNEEWDKTFDGGGNDYGRSVQQTIDGGYIITGHTTSSETDSDVWLIKTDPNGNEEWNKTFGGNDDGEDDYGYSVQQTTDGGYIITGSKTPYGTDNHIWLIKTDSNGDLLWMKSFHRKDEDVGTSVQQTTDGGYIITGYHSSVSPAASDIALIKTDQGGFIEWDRDFGGDNYDYGYSVQQTTDGGYIIAGNTSSYGSGYADVWLIKTDPNGLEEWNTTFGGNSGYAYGRSVQQTTDGGYIITGENVDGYLWLIKTDSKGNAY